MRLANRLARFRSLRAWVRSRDPRRRNGPSGARDRLAAPDFALPGIDGKVHRLGDYAASPILMVMFICNHCPTSQLYEGRIKKLADDYQDKGVATGRDPAERSQAPIRFRRVGYTDVSDSLEEMKIRAAYRHFNFPYLYDGETQSVSQAYGPKATPHVFIFDKERKLRYEGRIDNASANRW